MKTNINPELPIRSKLEMVMNVGKILGCLHRGDRSQAELLIDDLKGRALHLDDEIQHDVLVFAEQVHFQYDYDPCHNVTSDVTRAADHLIESLGFHRKTMNLPE
jgi:hypothetical protein